MKKTNLILILVMLFMVASLMTSTYFYMKTKQERTVQYIYADLTVSEPRVMSFDVNGTALRFARIPPGGTGLKKINMTNYHDYPIEVHVKTTGNITRFLTYSRTNFIILPGELTNLSISARVGLNETPAYYDGFVVIVANRQRK